MNKSSGSVVIVILLVLCIAACSVATVMSYRALAASGASQSSGEDTDVVALQDRITELGTQLAELEQKLAEVSRAPAESGEMAAGGDNGALDAELQRLSEIVRSSGLEDLANNGHVNPEFLESMHDIYERGTKLVDQRREMLSRNQTQRAKDLEVYGEDVAALYEQARPAFVREQAGSPEESDDAFLLMLEEYPDAYSTGMAIGERALQSAMQMDAEEVEEYYGLLSENENFTGVVTDMGIEAMPAIQNYLARQYIQDGEIDKAEELISALGSSPDDTMVAERGRSGEPSFRSTAEVVESLREQMSSGGGGSSGGGSAPPQQPR